MESNPLSADPCHTFSSAGRYSRWSPDSRPSLNTASESKGVGRPAGYARRRTPNAKSARPISSAVDSSGIGARTEDGDANSTERLKRRGNRFLIRFAISEIRRSRGIFSTAATSCSVQWGVAEAPVAFRGTAANDGAFVAGRARQEWLDELPEFDFDQSSPSEDR